MRAKRMCGKVYGADMTAAEKKAMNLEIQRQLAEYDQKHMAEIDSMILWLLHEVFGFGPKRLRRFYERFAPELEGLVSRYEMDDSDQVWLCTHMLIKYGVDLEQWREERRGRVANANSQ
jgi:hypothetical protein